MSDTIIRSSGVEVASRVKDADAVELICSEVWGGNREANTVVTLPGLTAVVYSHPCGGRQGGDVHYVTTCSAGMVSRVLVADVVGHGEEVAEVSRWLHRLMRWQMNFLDPRRVLRKLNTHLAKRGSAAMTTAVCVNYYADTGRLMYTYAGHPPLWRYRRETNQWTQLRMSADAAEREPDAPSDSVTNLPLGVSHDTRFESASVFLEPGDRIVLVSDGILEARNSKFDLFGYEALSDTLTRHADLNVIQFGQSVLGDVFEFAGQEPLSHDDATFITLEAGPRMKGGKMWVMLKQNMRKLMSTRKTA
jgi:serine phosphatase RsbU (regulator of sigma subunit)